LPFVSHRATCRSIRVEDIFGLEPCECENSDPLSLRTPEEIRDGLWFVDVCERWGSMDQAEADEWRRRVLARKKFPCPC